MLFVVIRFQCYVEFTELAGNLSDGMPVRKGPNSGLGGEVGAFPSRSDEILKDFLRSTQVS